MPPPRISNGLLAQLCALALSPSTQPRFAFPKRALRIKTHKGRPQVNTGGSTRGTTVTWGEYGLRLRSHDQRIAAKQFNNAVEVIRRRLKGSNFRMYTRVTANIAVYTKGNEQRMGKGKGGFDYWAARVAHGRVVVEIGGDAHEQVVKDALRLAGNKLPGQWEFIKKGDPPVVGTTRLKAGLTKEEMFRPRRSTPLHPLHLLPDGRRAGDVFASEQKSEDKLTGVGNQIQSASPSATVSTS